MIFDYRLIIEDGEPFAKGQSIPLGARDLVLGRSSADFIPDISFLSQYVSRRHAVITAKNQYYYISDLGSTHGTMLNDQQLVPFEPKQLNIGDKITLVKGIVSLSFQKEIDQEKTFLNLPKVFSQNDRSLVVDLDKRQVYINGEPLQISGKQLDLMLVLYEHKNKAISYDEIKKALWSERPLDANQVPDVGHDEIGSLVYRLRKSLGDPYGSYLKAIPRYGLILNLDQKPTDTKI